MRSMSVFSTPDVANDVSPANVARAGARCGRFRQLIQGGAATCSLHLGMAPSQWTAGLVIGCRDMVADDGFVYNVCALALDRALFHRAGLVRTLGAQYQQAVRHGTHAGRCLAEIECLQTSSWTHLNFCDVIQNSLACHIEVLVRAARHQDPQ